MATKLSMDHPLYLRAANGHRLASERLLQWRRYRALFLEACWLHGAGREKTRPYRRGKGRCPRCGHKAVPCPPPWALVEEFDLALATVYVDKIAKHLNEPSRLWERLRSQKKIKIGFSLKQRTGGGK